MGYTGWSLELRGVLGARCGIPQGVKVFPAAEEDEG